MTFELENVYTAVSAEKCKEGAFGYFANDIASLKQTIQNKKTTFKTFYSRLDAVCDDKFERRFSTPCGNFALFYPTDETENVARY